MSILELRPNRDLLDPNFNGYKLSLDAIPIYQKEFESEVDVRKPSESQFSFLHVKAFSLQNHLHCDPFNPDNVYFINNKWKIMQIILTPLNKIAALREVCEIPSNLERATGDYNVSMAFAEDLAVFSDGGGTIHIAETGSEWKVVHSDMLSGNIKFVVKDARLEKSSGKRKLNVLVLYIEEKEESGLCRTAIEVVRLVEERRKVWVKEAHKKLVSDGGVEFTALDTDCGNLWVVGDKQVKFVFDSESSVEEEKPMIGGAKYVWGQTDTGVSLKFDSVEETGLKIGVEDGKIDVRVGERVLLSGGLFSGVEKDVKWSWKDGSLEVELTKVEIGLTWSEVVVGDDKGEFLVGEELAKDVHERLAHLCSDKPAEAGDNSLNASHLEECDIPCDTATLSLLDAKTHAISQNVSLSASQFLFKKSSDLAVCVRHDVDACVWSLKNNELQHVATFLAFGYVQASKTQKKFMAAPPNDSFVVILEACRHIYLYRQPSALCTELRNRVTGRRVESIAKQQLVNLDSPDEILGVHATNSVLFVLMKNCIYVLAINE